MSPHRADVPLGIRRGVCRFCGAPLRERFLDLGMSPLANAYRTEAERDEPESFYPLCAWVCPACFLVQLEAMERPEEIFSDYAYYSSYSTSWLEHARAFAGSAVRRFGLTGENRVVEIGSNDGYLLQYFAQAGIPVLGVDPAANIADVAVTRGIPTEVLFFSADAAGDIVARHGHADLVIGNNVLAHVPDLLGFVRGLGILLAPGGSLSLEFPHLVRLIEGNQFDTIYHEHFSYFAFTVVRNVFAEAGLRLFDVEELPTHGGSLRVFGCRDDDERPDTAAVAGLLAREDEFGIRDPEMYRRFAERVRATKRRLLSFLIEARDAGRSVVGYGAAAKGTTLLNYCGIRADFLDYIVDRNPEKQGRYMPGTGIPIYPPERVFETRPDDVLILPWNLRDEISRSMSGVREWGGRFIVPIPEVEEVS